jgi:Peptidase family S58
MSAARVSAGINAILPHGGNLFQDKVPAGFAVGNGFGKFAGATQVEELGEVETPIVLTNTLSVAEGIAGVVEWTLQAPGIWRGKSARLQLPGQAISSRPVGAIRASLAFRVIYALLVGTADNAVGHCHRGYPVLAQEIGNFDEDRLVRPDVTGFGQPSAQLCRLPLRDRNDADRHFGGAAVVGAVEGDRTDRVTPRTTLGLFLEPFLRLPP